MFSGQVTRAIWLRVQVLLCRIWGENVEQAVYVHAPVHRGSDLREQVDVPGSTLLLLQPMEAESDELINVE